MSANQFDVIVVGEGLAGITAAAQAARQNMRVALLSKGPGQFIMGTACLDVGGLNTDRLSAAAPAQLDEALAFFVRVAASASCSYNGSLSDRCHVPTITGAFQEVSLAPSWSWKGDPRNASRITVAGVENLVGFDPYFLADRLNATTARMGYRNVYRGAEISLSEFHPPVITPIEIAERFDRDSGYRKAVLDRLRNVSLGAGLLIIPGMLGLKTGEADLGLYEEDIGCAICELATLPPSVTGLRLLHRLERAVTHMKVDLYTGFAVRRLCMEGGRCMGVELDTPGRPRVIAADAVILACGRFANLLEASPSGVNERLQPVDSSGTVVAENVFKCGSMLTGFESRHGNAIAVLSGYGAALQASERGVSYAAR